jgi:hypothetical protein
MTASPSKAEAPRTRVASTGFQHILIYSANKEQIHSAQTKRAAPAGEVGYSAGAPRSPSMGARLMPSSLQKGALAGCCTEC